MADELVSSKKTRKKRQNLSSQILHLCTQLWTPRWNWWGSMVAGVCVGGVLLFNVSLTFFFLNLFLKENQRGSYLVSFTNMTVTEKSANAHRHHLASCLSLRQVFMLDRHVGLTSNDNRHTHFMKQPKRLQKIKWSLISCSGGPLFFFKVVWVIRDAASTTNYEIEWHHQKVLTLVEKIVLDLVNSLLFVSTSSSYWHLSVYRKPEFCSMDIILSD